VSAPGFAAICDRAGLVREVLRNDLGVRVRPGAPLASGLSPTSVDKVFLLLQEIEARGTATGWELTVQLESGLQTAWCAGSRSKDDVVVLCAVNDDGLIHLARALSPEDRDRTAPLRAALEGRALVESGAERELDALMAVNNELASAQRELARAHAELRRVNAEKDTLLGMAAHDLRNPLFVSRSYAEFLLMDPSLSPAARKMVSRIYESSRYTLDLVTDLLDLSAIEAGALVLRKESTDLAELVRGVIDLDRLLAEKKEIALTLGRCDEGAPLRLDRRKFQQVMHNLLSNAIKFSHRGGQVQVEVVRDGGAVVVVSDDGVGMTDEQIESLFKPFGSGAPGTAGEKSTGLGMAIVKRIIEGHGGSIAVTSEPGAGTTVTVRVPSD